MSECTHTCISTPIAWFVLEQYRLGDLDNQIEKDTEEHLKRCPACAQAFAYIEQDQIVLPELPSKRSFKVKKLFTARQKIASAILAAAASLLFVLSVLHRDLPRNAAPIATKGGDLALSLIRLRGDDVVRDPTRFQDGDRFRMYVTSPKHDGEWPTEIVVYQDGKAFFPFPTGLHIPSGNLKGLGGAFTLSGEADVHICIILGDEIPSRHELQNRDPDSLPPNSLCVSLKNVHYILHSSDVQTD